MPETLPFDPVRVEIASPGTLKDGRRYYAVDFVEADGRRSDIYGGPNHMSNSINHRVNGRDD